MDSKVLIIVLLSFFHLDSFAQAKLITCKTERNADGTISINAESNAVATYTVKLVFTELSGYRSSVNTVSATRVSRGNTVIAKLTVDPSSNVRTIHYTYQYVPGVSFNGFPDTSFVYLLPSTANNTIRISKVSSLEERLGQKKPEDFYSTGFRFKLGDTICAARGGIVFNCTDGLQEGEKQNEAYTATRNRIGIEHKDGTIAHYSIGAPIKLLVATGDDVIPGQPLAVFIKESPKYIVMFSANYLSEKNLLYDNLVGSTSAPHYYKNITTPFYINEDEKAGFLQINKAYTVIQSKERIGAEMSKREKKKLGL